ncbi:MAG: hypothetical protein KDE46_09665, partial [Caldilineaceae bacterium]|nr:hypothetical protein [Caldilineaceae bacterium]
EWFVKNPDYADRILTTGIHRAEWGFTTAYHIHPDEIEPLMATHGIALRQMLACEGIVGHAETQINQLTGAHWEWWVDLNYRLSKDSALFGAAIHLLYVGYKVNHDVTRRYITHCPAEQTHPARIHQTGPSLRL